MPRGTRGSTTVWACVLAAACLIAAFLLPQAGSAHAALSRADPSPDSALPVSPARVTVWFSEPLAPALSGLEVFDTVRKRVDQGGVTFDRNDPAVMSVGLEPDLPHGTYTVAWRNVSTIDGHPLQGSFVFYVGERPPDARSSNAGAEPPTLPSPLDPWMRWLVNTSLLAAAGLLLFEAVILRPAIGSLPPREHVLRAIAQARRVLARLLGVTLGVLIAALLMHIVVQAAVATDTALWHVRPEGITDAVFDTTWGRYWALRLGLVTTASLAVLVLRAISRRRPIAAVVERVGWLPPFALLLGALATISQSSHAAALGVLAMPATLADFVHLMAATLWVGGLFAFAASVVTLAGTLDPAARRPVFGALASRFAIAAAIGLGALVITGLYASWLQVTTVPAIRTPYGYALVAKVALVALVAAAGAANLLWVRPRLARAERGGSEARWLSRFVVFEACVAVLVLLATAYITSMEPARQTYVRQEGGGIVFDQTDGRTRIRAHVIPGLPGSNTVRIELIDRRGQRVTDATDVTVTAKFLDAEIGESNANATLRDGSVYETPTMVLSIAGAWQVQVRATRPDAAIATAATRFSLSTATATGATGPPQQMGRALWGWSVVALGMLLLVVAPHGWRSRAARSRVHLASTAVVMWGVVLVYGASTQGSPQLMAVNPVIPNAASIEAGRALFAERCAQCHGQLGLGDGPLASTLNPPP